jgi:hypothetical protein
MVRLYEDACGQLLAIAPEKREAWLISRANASPGAMPLLMPVLRRFEDQPIEDMGAAKAWCRRFITNVTASA